MPSFRLDDVRDSFSGDIAKLLSEIETSVRGALDVPRAAAEAYEGSLQAIENDSHAIVGASGLVSVASLEQTAKIMEALAAQGRAELSAMRQHADRLTRL